MSQITAAPVPAPVRTGDRIEAIDAARGFALLGIFFVNIVTFAEPFGMFLEPVPGDVPMIDKCAFYFGKIFCEGKFYPLFSTLFGFGLALQMSRARAAGRRFWPLGLRRLAVLALIGLSHAFLLWYGDILFIYSVMGLALLLAGRLRAQTLAILAGAILVVATFITTAFMFLTTLGASGTPPDAAKPPLNSDSKMVAGATPSAPETAMTTDANPGPALEADMTLAPFDRLMRSFKNSALFEDAQKRGINPLAHPIWTQAETEAYRQGPYIEAMKFRAMSYGVVVVVTLLGFGWSIAAMFLFGAALMKWDAFAPHRLHWHKRFALIGLGIGLPLSALSHAAPALWGLSGTTVLVFIPLQVLAGPMVALGYLGAIRLLMARGVAPAFFRALACAGRMALTCYLLETTLSTLIFYHYGLAWFGTLTRVQELGVVLVIYTGLVLFSTAWLARFRFGPMEWLWRSLTYLRMQPLRRANAT